jgi:beta-lactamase regulating signal transducer with metallopeptidase domain/thiol-disulfide isomerase/thioredoxin
MTPVETLLSPATVEWLGWSLLHFVWQGIVVAALLAATLAMLRRRSPNSRYLVACVAMCVMAAAPFVTATLIAPSRSSLPAVDAVMTSVQPDARVDWISTAPPPVDGVRHSDITIPPPDPKNIPFHVGLVALLEAHLPWIVGAWLLGVAVLSARLMVGWAQAQRLMRRHVVPASDPFEDALSRLKARLRVSRPVRLLESTIAKTPAVVGWVRPAILLPVSCVTGLSREQIDAILAHELAHIRRYDYLVNLLQSVVETLLFYHPAVWWVSRRIRIEREHCCDDLAIAACGDKLAYAKALTHVAEMASGSPRLAAAASAMSLTARIRRILSGSMNRSPRFGQPVAVVLVAALVAAVVLGLNPASTEALSDEVVAQAENGRPPNARKGKEIDNRPLLDQLTKLVYGIHAYSNDHASPPVHLSQLYPDYVNDLNSFIPAGSDIRIDSKDQIDERSPFILRPTRAPGEKSQQVLVVYQRENTAYAGRADASVSLRHAQPIVNEIREARRRYFEDTAHILDRNPEGQVLDPDGQPVVGAKIILVPRSANVHFARNEGNDLRGGTRLAETESDQHGRFAFNKSKERYAVAVTHELGYGEATDAELLEHGAIKLTPWGRVEGTLRIGAKPAEGRWVSVDYAQPYDPTLSLASAKTPLLFRRHDVECDEAGRFVFDRVPAGSARIAYYIEDHALNRPIHAALLVIRPDETTNIDIGGTGRPVVGRLPFGKEVLAEIDWSTLELVVTDRQQKSRSAPRRQPPAIPVPNRRGKFTIRRARPIPSIAQRDWRGRWSETSGEATFLYLVHEAGGVRHAAAIRPDGWFRIEDVPAGSYTLTGTMKLSGKFAQDAGKGLRLIRYDFDVGRMEGGRSDTPLVLDLTKPADRKPTEGRTRKAADDAAKRGVIELRFTFCEVPRSMMGRLEGVSFLSKDGARDLLDDDSISLLDTFNTKTLNGKTATLHAGGEIRIPVLQDDGTPLKNDEGKMEFRYEEFGVRIEATPKITTDDRIQIDLTFELIFGEFPENGRKVDGVVLPKLANKKSQFGINLESGQSAVATHLLESKSNWPERLKDFTYGPFLKELKESEAFMSGKTELVVFVEAELGDAEDDQTDDAEAAEEDDTVKIPGDAAKVERFLVRITYCEIPTALLNQFSEAQDFTVGEGDLNSPRSTPRTLSASRVGELYRDRSITIFHGPAMIMVKNGVTGRYDVGQRVPVPVLQKDGTAAVNDDGSVKIRYEPIGLETTLTPKIVEGAAYEIDVGQTLEFGDSATGTKLKDSDRVTQDIRTLTSQIRLRVPTGHSTAAIPILDSESYAAMGLNDFETGPFLKELAGSKDFMSGKSKLVAYVEAELREADDDQDDKDEVENGVDGKKKPLSAAQIEAIKKKRADNIRNLVYASLAYANDHENQLPEKFSDVIDLYLKGSLELFAPPGSDAKIESRDQLDEQTVYVLRPGLNAGLPSETIVIGEPYDPLLDGAHFVQMGGKVLFKTGDEAKELYKELKQARADYANRKEDPTQWGRVEGVLRVGDRPGRDHQIWLLYQDRKHPSGVRLDYQRKTDGEGRFFFEKVPIGTARLYSQPLDPSLGASVSHGVYIDIEPQRTARAVLGGKGRPVVGRIVNAGELKWNEADGSLNSDRPQPMPPIEVRIAGPDAIRAWAKEWRAENDTEEKRRSQRGYGLLVNPDGSFRGEDVLPGRYRLHLTLNQKRDDGSGRWDDVGSVTKTIEILEAPVDEPRSPFDLGDVVAVPKRELTPLKIGDEAPPFEATTLDGKPLQLSDYRGKYVLLYVWSSLCNACLADNPNLKELSDAFGKDERFVLIGLSTETNVEDAKKYTAERQLPGIQGHLPDGGSGFFGAGYVTQGPTLTFLIGPNGSLLATDLDSGDIKSALARALASEKSQSSTGESRSGRSADAVAARKKGDIPVYVTGQAAGAPGVSYVLPEDINITQLLELGRIDLDKAVGVGVRVHVIILDSAAEGAVQIFNLHALAKSLKQSPDRANATLESAIMEIPEWDKSRMIVWAGPARHWDLLEQSFRNVAFISGNGPEARDAAERARKKGRTIKFRTPNTPGDWPPQFDELMALAEEAEKQGRWPGGESWLVDAPDDRPVRKMIGEFVGAVKKGDQAAVDFYFEQPKHKDKAESKTAQLQELIAAGMRLDNIESVIIRGDHALASTEIGNPRGRYKVPVCLVYEMAFTNGRWIIREMEVEDTGGLINAQLRFEGTYPPAKAAADEDS